MTDNEFLELCVIQYNSESGDLKYYNCEKCKNKGMIAFIDNEQIKYKKCSCGKQRKIYKNLFECGISINLFNQYTFENYKAQETWQNKILNKAQEYINTFANSNWFVISGVSGSGKSHICTAIFKSFIDKGFNVKYALWNETVETLKQYKKSAYTDIIEKHKLLLNDLKNVDVLYIDDFLKLFKLDDLELAFEIINHRYMNNLITIISTELSKDEIGKIDVALCGRIVERSKGYWLDQVKDINRNYRLKGDLLC